MYENDIRQQRINIIEMVHDNHIPAHISPAMAALEIFNVLLRDVMDIKYGIDDNRSDKLVLSNGHIALALYAVYETMGLITKEDFYTYRKRNSKFGMHQDRLHTPGTVFSVGSLGHGLPNAVGLAYAWKMQGKNNRVFITVGDGEMNEGSIWEAIIFAAHKKLDNVCCIIDDNKSTEYMPDIEEKFKAFGWNTVSIDGHNEEELRNALSNRPIGKPYAVIANTIKGHGIKIVEDNHAKWHERVLSEDDYDLVMKELRANE